MDSLRLKEYKIENSCCLACSLDNHVSVVFICIHDIRLCFNKQVCHWDNSVWSRPGPVVIWETDFFSVIYRVVAREICLYVQLTALASLESTMTLSAFSAASSSLRFMLWVLQWRFITKRSTPVLGGLWSEIQAFTPFPEWCLRAW